jgi:hypothetical protein
MSVLLVQQLRHVSLVDAQDRARRDRRGASHPTLLTGQASLAEEVTWAKHGDHGLFSGLRQHRQLDAAGLNVPDMLAGIALSEDKLATPIR